MAELRGRVLVAGEAAGELLVLDEPLSFWGGVDPETGKVIDQRHPQVGRNVSGTVLAMTIGRGSSSSSTVLAECCRAGTAPAAILLLETDEILVLGALVAELIDGVTLPIVQLPPEAFAELRGGDRAFVGRDGLVVVEPHNPSEWS